MNFLFNDFNKIIVRDLLHTTVDSCLMVETVWNWSYKFFLKQIAVIDEIFLEHELKFLKKLEDSYNLSWNF